MVDLTDDLGDGPLAAEGYSSAIATSSDDALTLSGVFTYVVIPGGANNDNVKLTDSFTYGGYLASMVLGETLTMGAAWGVTALKTIAEHFNLSSSFVAYLNGLLRQGVKLSETYIASMTYHLSLAEKVSLLALFDYVNAASFSDHFVMSDATPTYMFTANSSISEIIRLSVDLRYNVVIRLAFSDALDMSDGEVLNFIYQGSINELVVAEVLYQTPDGGITAWAINTRNNAITEYRDWSFNSFAYMGRKFLAADENGLYELNGARDGDDNILSILASGFFQPNGSKFSGLKGVYLGVGGQGSGATPTWLLKLDMGDGREYVYQTASNPNQMTTKFNIGKGLRSRYMAWTLINQDGQDFDLDTVEFVPMMSGRRV